MSVKEIIELTFYEDAGHGWLKVPKSLLSQFGVANDMTCYSYEKDGHAYLEEDLDMQTFVDAVSNTEAYVVTYKRIYHDYSPVRGFRTYMA